MNTAIVYKATSLVVSLNKPRASTLLLRSPNMSSRRQPIAPRAAAAASNGDVQGDMLEPSFANKSVVRAAALLATVAAGARSTQFLPAAGLGFVHVLAYGSWLGTLVWTSFIFGIVAFRNLPRQTFGSLQAKLFPKYFTLSAVCSSLLMGSLYYLTGGNPPVKEMWLLGISAVSSFMNLFFVEPAATKVMFERYKLENEPAAMRDAGKIDKLKKNFGKWHGISSLFNLATLVCAIGHGYYLGGRLGL